MAREKEISTGRLALRPLRRGDIGALVALLNDFQVSRWLSVVPFPYGHEDGEGFVTSLANADPLTALAIIAPEGLVGVVGINPGLGYWLGRAHHGQGYMSEAAGALVDHYFTTRDAASLSSGYFSANAASARVLQKLGFVSNGTEKVKARAQGVEVTLQKVILHRRVWQARHAG